MLRLIFIGVFFIFVASVGYAAEGFQYGPDDHTLGLWQMNEGEGDEVGDESPNGFLGFVEGNPDWGEEGWKKDEDSGTSFLFDGTTVINLGNVKELITPEAITVEAWVFPEDLGGWKLICSNWDGPPGAFHLACENATPKFHINTDNGGSNAAAAQQLEVGNWYHIAGTYDSGTGDLKIYVDGEESGAVKHGGDLFDNDFDVVIASKNSGDFKWIGLMDDMRISDVARDPEELSPNLTGPFSVSPQGSLIITWAAIRSK